MLRQSPDALFVFGDNLSRKGFGGQASEMRGEPNAVGIPTKRAPYMHESAFFNDNDLDEAGPAIKAAFARLFEHAQRGGTIFWPADGIGTGLAQLPTRAPSIWRLIEFERDALAALTAGKCGEGS